MVNNMIVECDAGMHEVSITARIDHATFSWYDQMAPAFSKRNRPLAFREEPVCCSGETITYYRKGRKAPVHRICTGSDRRYQKC